MKAVKGAALLWVLWVLMLGSALIAVLVNTSTTQQAQASISRNVSQDKALADAGLALAVWHLDPQSPAVYWPPDGHTYTERIANTDVQISINDELAKIDINQASQTLLQRLLMQCGQTTDTARKVSANVVDWRDSDDLLTLPESAEQAQYQSAGRRFGPSNRPFETISDLKRVLGVDDALYQAIAPFITVHSGLASLTQTYASETVLQSLGSDALTLQALQAPVRGSGTYHVLVKIERKDRADYLLNVIVRLDQKTQAGLGYRVLSLSKDVGDVN